MTPGMDLAVLKLDDEAFFDNRGTLPFAEELPRVKDNINVYGYPTGGTELSVTQGIVSRIEYTDYYYQATGLRIQVDAALNFGNSGGPAVSDANCRRRRWRICFRSMIMHDLPSFRQAAEYQREQTGSHRLAIGSWLGVFRQ